MLKLFPMQSLIEKYTDKTLKKAIKILTKPLYNKESRAKLKRKADKKLVDIIDDLLMEILIQMLKPFHTLNHTETLVKKAKYIEEKLRKMR